MGLAFYHPLVVSGKVPISVHPGNAVKSDGFFPFRIGFLTIYLAYMSGVAFAGKFLVRPDSSAHNTEMPAISLPLCHF